MRRFNFQRTGVRNLLRGMPNSRNRTQEGEIFVLNEIAGFVSGNFIFFDLLGLGLFEREGERITPATVVGNGLAGGGADGFESFGVGAEGADDGAVDDGPEFVFGGGEIRVHGDEDDFVVLGQSGQALPFAGVTQPLVNGGPALGRELDSVQVGLQVGDGE